MFLSSRAFARSVFALVGLVLSWERAPLVAQVVTPPMDTNRFLLPLTRIAELDKQLWPEELAWKDFSIHLRSLLEAWKNESASNFPHVSKGSWPSESVLVAAEPGNVRITRLERHAPAEHVAEKLNSYRKQFEAVDRVEFEATSLTNNGNTLSAAIIIRVSGSFSNAGRFDQLEWTLSATKRDAKWSLEKLACTKIESASGPLLFTNIYSNLPFPQPASVPLLDVGYFAEGLSLVDLDADGDLDIFAMRKLGPIALLRNLGANQFADVSRDSGLPPVTGGRSSWFFDWDNDGDLDLLLLTNERIWAFEKDGKHFKDVSSASSFDRMFTMALTSAAIADYDRDGFLDVYITSYGDPRRRDNFDYFDSNSGFFNKLFRNKGNGSFEDVTEQAGLEKDNSRWTYAALWIDYNDDLAPDLYVINDYGPKQLFANDGKGNFKDVAVEAGVTDYGNGMGGSWADYDGDGLLDLYLSNIHSYPGLRALQSTSFTTNEVVREQAWRFTRGNTLLRNLGNGKFEDIADTPLARTGWAWGNVFLDYDNDGDRDCYVVNGMYSAPQASGRTNDLESHFWRHILSPIANKDQRLREGSAVMGYSIGQGGTSFCGYQRNAFFQNLGGGEFAELGSVSGADLLADGRAVAAGDVDNDGDLDLVLANRNSPELLLLSNTAPVKRKHLALQLVGTKSNRMGIGAKVSVTANGKRQVQALQFGSGYVTQGPNQLWFGVGDSDTADAEVIWPSGATNRFEKIKAGQTATLTEQ